MKRTFVSFLLFLVGFWLTLVLIGPKIDEACLEGRLSEEQAESINSLSWGKCPSYRNGKCSAIEGDRVLAKTCSELSRKFFLQDWR